MAKKKAVKKTTKKTGRDYRSEYDNYQGTEEQKKNRAGRNKSRRQAERDGIVSKGDGKDIHHKDGNPRNNSKKNRQVMKKSLNRSKK